MTDRSSRGTRRTGSFLPHYREMLEKWAARGCKRPKSREETPKEGGDNAKESRYRAATICQCDAQKARGIDLSSQPVAARPRLPHGKPELVSWRASWRGSRART